MRLRSNPGKGSGQSFKEEIDRIIEDGIQMDRQRLKTDMCSQFSNEYEWIREYVVNSWDSGASKCWIRGRDDETTYTISIEDNGRGMDRETVTNYFKIFSSMKQNVGRHIVGSHGIGKLSAAAVAGQCGFLMETCTGQECWRAKAGSLLAEEAIVLEQVAVESLSPGTRFELTFEKDISFARVMRKLGNILGDYLKYLSMEIVIYMPDKASSVCTPYTINRPWNYTESGVFREYDFNVGEMHYQVVFALGSGRHELYNNRVFVSDKYNFLGDAKIANLDIRVDSTGFRLPFGRHRLLNEDVLNPLGKHLKTHELPDFFDYLNAIYESGRLQEFDLRPSTIEEFAVDLLSVDSVGRKSWAEIPIFNLVDKPRISYSGLIDGIREHGFLYYENGKSTGIDGTLISIPILADKQPGRAKDLFYRFMAARQIIALDQNAVFEDASKEGVPLTDQERRFEQHLKFHPEVKIKDEYFNKPKRASETVEGAGRYVSGRLVEKVAAERELDAIKWRVNYLVNMDGSPCHTHKFLLRNKTVVLNLNFPDVKKLVTISEKWPVLAGHWAMAICLTENNNILPHLAYEAREDLIMEDAIAKCVTGLPDQYDCGARSAKRNDGPEDENLRDFLRDLLDD